MEFGNPRRHWFSPKPMVLVIKNAMPSAYGGHPDSNPVIEKLVEKEPEKRGRGVL